MRLEHLNPVRAVQYVARRTLGTVYRFQTPYQEVAVTFDDGPDQVDTPRVLECLARHGAKATFFMVGEAAAAYPEIVARVHDEGHTIGIHTFSHVSMARTGWPERNRELTLCREALGSLAKPYFRMPFGHQTLPSHLQAMLMGYSIFGWTHKTEDTMGHSASHMLSLVNGVVRPGDIVSFHDTVYHYRNEGERDREQMLLALDRFLEDHVRQGFSFVNLEIMMRRGTPERTHWYRYPNEAEFAALTKKTLA